MASDHAFEVFPQLLIEVEGPEGKLLVSHA